MAHSQDDRKRIREELARKRAELSDQSLRLRRNLNIGRRTSDLIRKHSWEWISLAAIFGWLLSRLPARKKKIYIHTANSEKRKSQSHGILFYIWMGTWSLAKPIITAYFTKKITEKANWL
jgi:hypothetical protein